MKKIYTMFMAAAFAATAFAQRGFTPPAELSDKYGFKVDGKTHLYRVSEGKKVKAFAQETVYDVLSCKEGSVYGNEYTENTAWTGSACADAGRPELGMEYYQYFDDCFYTFNEVRFLGFFNYFDEEAYDWIYCHERGEMDEDLNMTKPVTFTIGIYEEGEDGLPGKCVMQKDVDLIGENTNVVLEGLGDTGTTPIYEFKVPLGQTINLEHGYIQINAKDMGDSPSCWFAVFTVGGNLTALQKDIINEEYSGQNACAFCLYGDGSYNADKALQIERFMTPLSSASGKYEKVQVELTNIGKNAISDARLELYVDGVLVATEDVNATIEPFESYKYTFTARADCSGGKHVVTVKNVTPGDELKSYQSLSKTVETTVANEYPECEIYVPKVINITNVSLGSINNTSEGSTYSDYTDQKTVFRPGEKQTLNVTIESNDYEPTLGVFIDWNGDYTFSYDEQVVFDSFEADDNGGKAVATISVPEGAKTGEHRMRLIALPYYYTLDPAGSFYNGEVEDYTIVVEPSPEDPVTTADKTVIEQFTDGKDATSVLTLTNSGGGTLNADIDFKYVLPNAPTSNYAAKVAPKAEFKGQLKAARIKAVAQKAPKSDPATQYVLKYDSDVYDCIGIGNAPNATFASLYPGAMLSSLKGMTVSSVDVYVGDVPESASIVIYGQKKQSECGDLITEQAFTPKAQSWNHVVLSQPVEIGTTDLWIGVRMENIVATGYYIGVDEGPAVIGFGDLVNIGGSTWWSMADLGLDYNYCIRANVTGDRTPAISWLSTDKKSMEVAAGSEGKLNVSFTPQGLEEGVYEAYLEVSTNDPFNSFIRIPVYMVNGELTAIGSVEQEGLGITLNGGNVTIKGGKTIAALKVSDLTGRCLMTSKPGAEEATVSLSQFAKGVYVITATYADGKSVSVKVPALK